MIQHRLNAWGIRKKMLSQSLQIGSVLWHFFNASPGYLQLCFSLHFLLTWNIKVNQRWNLWVSSHLFWVCVQRWVCVWTLRDPDISGSFPKTLFLQVSPSQATSFPGFLICLLFALPRPQVAVANTFAFKCFQQTLPRKPLQPWEAPKQEKQSQALELILKEPLVISKHKT